MIRRNYKYDVSFSFAEENVDFVAEVAEHLKGRGSDYRYYFYKEDVVATWGKDLEKHLSLVYKRQSRLCVVFVSAAYLEKVWTQFELEKAQIKAKREVHEYILQFKMDDTVLPGIPSTIKYLQSKDFSANGLADAICKKVDDHKTKDRFPLWAYGRARYYFRSPRHLTVLAALVILVFGFPVRDRLTPVKELMIRLYERNTVRVKGAVCRDGSLSEKRGRGTCSHHGGVSRKIDTLIPRKSLDECRELARDISWLPE